MFALHFILLESIAYFSASSSTGSALGSALGSAFMVKGFKKFLLALGENQKYDHLRLPLQASALLTPILLLNQIQIHRSEYFCQRYRVMLVCAIFPGF